MKTSEQLNELFAALSKAQGQMGIAVFDSTNPHFKNKFASLTAILETAKKPLADNGLSLTQPVEYDHSGGYSLTSRLGHSSGQWIESSIKLILQKDDMQGLGSATTYAKRYAASAILGIVSDEDDDGHAASKAAPKSSAKAPPYKLAPGSVDRDEVDRLLRNFQKLGVSHFQIGEYFKIPENGDITQEQVVELGEIGRLIVNHKAKVSDYFK